MDSVRLIPLPGSLEGRADQDIYEYFSKLVAQSLFFILAFHRENTRFRMIHYRDWSFSPPSYEEACRTKIDAKPADEPSVRRLYDEKTITNDKEHEEQLESSSSSIASNRRDFFLP